MATISQSPNRLHSLVSRRRRGEFSRPMSRTGARNRHVRSQGSRLACCPAEKLLRGPRAYLPRRGLEMGKSFFETSATNEGVVRPYPLDELRLQRIKKTTPTRHGTWEFDGFYSPAPVQGEDRPYFPYSFLCADHESGFIFATALTEPSTWQMEFPKAFLDCIENHHLFPNTLRLRKEELRELFEPLANGLGIQVQLTKKLPAVDRAKKALF